MWPWTGRRATDLCENRLQDSDLVGRDCDPPPLGLGLLLLDGPSEGALVYHPSESTPRRELILKILERRLILTLLAWLLLHPARWDRRRKGRRSKSEAVVVLCRPTGDWAEDGWRGKGTRTAPAARIRRAPCPSSTTTRRRERLGAAGGTLESITTSITTHYDPSRSRNERLWTTLLYVPHVGAVCKGVGTDGTALQYD